MDTSAQLCARARTSAQRKCPARTLPRTEFGTRKWVEIVKRGQSQMQGSADRILATDICQSLRIISKDARQAVAYIMDAKFRQDHNLKRRFLGHKQSDDQWKRFLQNVECQDAFEQKNVLKDRRLNSGHCSYVHRWFQHPIWRLGQARVGNGPYTLVGEHHEPVMKKFEIPNLNSSIPEVSKPVGGLG
eukprot:529372-Amphidinium_carterae.2